MMKLPGSKGSSSRVNSVNGCDDKRLEILLTQAVAIKGKKQTRKKGSGGVEKGKKKYRV